MIHLDDLPNLQRLDLSATEVGDAGLAHLRGFRSLCELNLANTFVTDSGLRNLNDLTGLKRLDLSMTRVDDSGLRHLRGLNQLEELLIANSLVSNTGLMQMRYFPRLRFVNASTGFVSRQALEELHRARPDIRIEGLTHGGIPDEKPEPSARGFSVPTPVIAIEGAVNIRPCLFPI
jgi:hypothetical protein